MSGSADVVVSPARVVVPGLRLPPWQPLRHADHPHGCAGLAGWECETVATGSTPSVGEVPFETTVLPSYAATLTVLAAVILSGCAGQAEHRPAAPGITEPPRTRRRTWEPGRERHADGGRTDRRHDPYEAARRSYPPRLPAARITRDASRSRSCAVPQHSPGRGLRSSWRTSPCPRTRLCRASPSPSSLPNIAAPSVRPSRLRRRSSRRARSAPACAKRASSQNLSSNSTEPAPLGGQVRCRVRAPPEPPDGSDSPRPLTQ